uniref:Retrovirus-related Pol polyprotein from transposon TNT 1-94 n=1 Tax=Tanacetum cinerariifolium TaxID=118510 RepID=A0A6L2K1G9_TANCI|nr:hypothetical protein [Tanacetum cinerariifolium]
MACSGTTNVIARRAIDEIAEFNEETETPKYMKVFILQEIAEARRFIRVQREEAQSVANDVTFLFYIMLWLLEASNVSVFMCTGLLRSRVAEYGARYAQFVAVHTTYTLEMEPIVKHDWSITLATSLCAALFGIFKDKMKYVFGRSCGEDDSFAKLMHDLCLALRISLSKKRRLVAELEALGEREGAAKPLKHMRYIFACDDVTLGELETLLAHAQVGVSLKVGYVADMEENNNDTAKDLWDALKRQMRGFEYGEQDRKAVILYEFETFKATEGEQLLDTYFQWKQYGTLMRQTKNLMDINIDALYNILKQNQGDVNDAMGYKKKVAVVTSDPLALIAEKTKITALLAKDFNRKNYYAKPTNNNLRTSLASSSVNKKPKYVKSEEKKEDKKADEKKRDMSIVKCYNCKKKGHFAKDCKKANVKDYNYYKTKMLLAKKNSDEQVFFAEDQAWIESSSDSDQEINANMVFMAKMEKVLSYPEEKYYDNSTNYSLFVDNIDDHKIFHDAIEYASENFNENHIISQKDHDESEVDHNDSEEKDHLFDKLIKKFNQKIAKFQKHIEKANQQSKDLENQNKDLHDKYDVLQNQANTFEVNNIELNEQIKVLNEKNDDLLAQTEVIQEQIKVKHVVIDTHIEYTLSSVRRPKHSSVIWKMKGSSNTSNVDLSSVSILKLNKDVKRYSRKDLLSCNNSHHVDTRSAYACNNTMNVSCNSRLYVSCDVNDLFVFDDIVQIFLWIIDLGCSKHMTDGVDLLTGDRSSNLYTIALNDISSNSLACLLAKASSSQSCLWHQHFSHLNFTTINNLVKNNLVQGLPKMKFKKNHLCSACDQVKIHRKHRKSKMALASNTPLYLLYMDLCDEAFEVIISFIKKTQVNLQLQVQRVRTDNGIEFKNKTLAKFFDEVGITQQFSAARTPQQNGVVERRNRTLVEAARTMLTFVNLPLFLWAEAIATAYFTQNHLFFHKRFDKTPYELINKRKPNIKFFYVFGCRCYLLNDYDNVGKLKAKGDIGVFVRYSKEYVAFKVYNKRTRKPHESVNVNFDEISKMASKQFSLEPGLSNLNETGKSLNSMVSQVSKISKKDLEDLFHNFYDEYFDSSKITKSPTTNVETSNNEIPSHEGEVFHDVSESFQEESSSSLLNDDIQQSSEEVMVPLTNTQSVLNESVSNVNEASSSHNVFNERLEDAYFDASTTFHDPSNVHTFYQPYPHEKKWTKDHPLHKIIGNPKSSVCTRGQLANSCLFACLLSSIEPANVAEALKDADWVSAMQDELDQFARLKVWRLVPRPEGKTIIKTK